MQFFLPPVALKFTTIIHSSCILVEHADQQISNQAANTVKIRFLNLVGEITPENILNITIIEIQQCGMTMRKAEYIKEIAESAIREVIDFDSLKKSPDKEVIKELIQLKGVAEWTTERLLINSLNRPNIISYHDLVIRRGMKRLYKIEELPKKTFNLKVCIIVIRQIMVGILHKKLIIFYTFTKGFNC